MSVTTAYAAILERLLELLGVDRGVVYYSEIASSSRIIPSLSPPPLYPLSSPLPLLLLFVLLKPTTTLPTLSPLPQSIWSFFVLDGGDHCGRLSCLATTPEASRGWERVLHAEVS